MYTKPVLGKAWSQCCGQEDAVSTNWQSLTIHGTLLSQLNIDNSICGEADCKRQPPSWQCHCHICSQTFSFQSGWFNKYALKILMPSIRSYQYGLNKISSCNKCWWQNRSSQIKRFCYTLYFPYCHHAKRKMPWFLWSLYKILRPPSPLGLWQNFRRNIFWGTKQGTNVIFNWQSHQPTIQHLWVKRL